MSKILPQSLVSAANVARDALLATLDPDGVSAIKNAAAPKSGGPPPPPPGSPGGPPPPPPGGPGGPPPPPGGPGGPGGAKKGLFERDMFGDNFFVRVEALFTPGDKLLVSDDASHLWNYARWVNYFFAQCGGGGTIDDRGRVYTLLLNLDEHLKASATAKFGYRQLERKSSSVLPAPLRTEFAALVNTAPGGQPLDMLTYLLNLGFTAQNTVSAREVKMTSYGMSGEDLTNIFGNAFGLQAATKTNASERDASAGYLLFYRGDSRSPALVVQQKGATCRADLGFWRNDAQVDAAWHPWKSSLASGGDMWLRNGDKDNDYFTVNSVGLHFHISCAYPMLKLSEFDRTLTGHVTDWSRELCGKLRRSGKADVFRARNRKTGIEEPVLVDKSRVYLCVFPDTTELSATYKAKESYGGNTYPETGVRNVPLNQIVAWIEIERFHNDDTLRSSGGYNSANPRCYESTGNSSRMTIKMLSWGWLSPKGQGKNILGLESPSALAQRLQSMMGRCFEINHSCLISESDTTYDPSTKKWFSLEVAAVKPLQLH